jgi:hypothetical protein
MDALPARLSDADLARVEAYAAAPLPALPRADHAFMLQFMRMLSDMPRQQADEVSGEVKVENMLRLLGHLPRATLTWISDEAHRRHTFHPSIKELLDLAKEWTRSDDSVVARARAGRLAREERHARLVDARKALRLGQLGQDAIDALDERIKAILETESLLWRCECGSYAARRNVKAEDGDHAGILARLDRQFASKRGEAQAA